MPLTSRDRSTLKARAQRLEPSIRVGKEGVSDGLLRALDEALTLHDLVKVRFADFKEEKKTLAPELAARTGSELIMRVGHVAVYYRAKAAVESVAIQ